MTRARILHELVTLAVLSVACALLLLPAFAVVNGSANPFAWPPTAQESVGVMAAAIFLVLGGAELLTRGKL